MPSRPTRLKRSRLPLVTRGAKRTRRAEACRYDDATDASSPVSNTTPNELLDDQLTVDASAPFETETFKKQEMAHDADKHDGHENGQASDEASSDIEEYEGDDDTDKNRVSNDDDMNIQTERLKENNEKKHDVISTNIDTGTKNKGDERQSIEGNDDDPGPYSSGNKSTGVSPSIGTPTQTRASRRVTRSHSRLDGDEVDSGDTSDEPAWNAVQLERLADAIMSQRTLDPQVLSRELRRATRTSHTGTTVGNASTTARYFNHVIDTIQMTKRAAQNRVSSSRLKSFGPRNAKCEDKENKKWNHNIEKLDTTDCEHDNNNTRVEKNGLGNTISDKGQETLVSENVSRDEVRAFMAADVLRLREGAPLPVARAVVHKKRAGEAAVRLRKVWRAAFDARVTAETAAAEAALQLSSVQAAQSATQALRRALTTELETIQQLTTDTEASLRRKKQSYALLFNVTSDISAPLSPLVSPSPPSSLSVSSASAKEQVDTDLSGNILPHTPAKPKVKARARGDTKTTSEIERKKIKKARRRAEMNALRSKIMQKEAESMEYQRAAQAVCLECDLVIEQKESLQREVYKLEGQCLKDQDNTDA